MTAVLRYSRLQNLQNFIFLNKTDWDKFAEATGADESDLETVEDLVETSEKYYNWTDEQTEEPDDGKALFWKRCNGKLYVCRCETAWRKSFLK